jgi:Bacterial Ig domain
LLAAPIALVGQQAGLSGGLAGSTGLTGPAVQPPIGSLSNPGALIPGAAGFGNTAAATFPAMQASPSVVLTSPADGAAFGSQATIPLTATAAIPSGVTQMNFLDGAALVGSSATAPFVFNLDNVTPGIHAFTAQAVTPFGTINSAPTFVTVATPTTQINIRLIAPLSGTVFRVGSEIMLVATASSFNSPVTSVEFFANQTDLGTGVISSVGASISPLTTPEVIYSFVWHTVVAGQFVITAVATDTTGASTISFPEIIIVQ